ncbi:MAG: antibiotic biosynthesis monooxygenase [Flavobacteriaceae bacterium]|nr:antibiotic biosynthesis monooxygenase [Flavobacteriaceae bacterium]
MIQTPYYAVIFTSKQTHNLEGYSAMAVRMEELAKTQKGYLGFEHGKGGLNVTVSYWETLEDIKNWKAHTAHAFAQEKGKEDWYKWYKVRICKVEKEYEFNKE